MLRISLRISAFLALLGPNQTSTQGVDTDVIDPFRTSARLANGRSTTTSEWPVSTITAGRLLDAKHVRSTASPRGLVRTLNAVSSLGPGTVQAPR